MAIPSAIYGVAILPLMKAVFSYHSICPTLPATFEELQALHPSLPAGLVSMVGLPSYQKEVAAKGASMRPQARCANGSPQTQTRNLPANRVELFGEETGNCDMLVVSCWSLRSPPVCLEAAEGRGLR